MQYLSQTATIDVLQKDVQMAAVRFLNYFYTKIAHYVLVLELSDRQNLVLNILKCLHMADTGQIHGTHATC